VIEELGEKVLAMAKLWLPGEIRQRTQADHVKRLAQSIDELVMINPPTVRKDGSRYQLLAGRDRVAAHVLLQRAEIRCRIVRCSDREAKLIELAEDAHRRNADESSLRALTEEIDRLRELPEVTMEKSKKTPLQRAVARVAKAAGVDQKLLARAYRRHSQEEPEKPREVEVKLHDIGMPLEEPFKKQIGSIQYRVAMARDLVAKTKAHLAALRTMPMPNRVRRNAEELAAQLEVLLGNMFPASLCPYCKGVAGVQESCALCEMQGWICQAKIESVDDKFFDQVDRIVMVAAKPERLADLLRSRE
jgi:ParB-like chromosome segregation protein Spo0J